MYRSDGTRVNCSSLDEVLQCESGIVFTPETITHPDLMDSVERWVTIPKHKVISNDTGKPLLARLMFGNRSSWIVSTLSWQDPKENEGVDYRFCGLIQDVFDHLEVGPAPTPSSLGRQTMRYVYRRENLGYHTCLSLNCEDYLHKHDFGGIAISMYQHKSWDVMYQADLSSAWVAWYDLHPTQGACWFTGEPPECATWFGECIVKIHDELALGIFPVRRENGRVVYPTKRGVYKTHLWSETAKASERVGCDIRVIAGYSWPSFTDDNRRWAEWVYNKRYTSKSQEIERKVKKVAVSSIGSHGRGRNNHLLVGPENYDPERDYPAIDGSHGIDLWVHPDRDNRGASMVHWNHYTINRCNLAVREFAYPYAVNNTLILVDYDSIFTIDETLPERVIKKKSAEALNCKPGTWLWELHHNFHIYKHRIWSSDETPGRYGKLREGLLK